MFQPWRLKVREAEEAYKRGRLEEASRLLADRELIEFLPAKQLMAQVAEQMTHRAERRFAAGATLAGWRDLEEATRLGAAEQSVDRVKQQFMADALREAESYLHSGDPAAAVERLTTLEQQGAGGREFRLSKEAATKVLAAQHHAHAGQFTTAEAELSAAISLRPQWAVLGELRQACRERGDALRRHVESLHAALTEADWPVVLSHAEAILELCPDHEPACDAMRRAWAAVGTELIETKPLAGRCGHQRRTAMRRTATHMPKSEEHPVALPHTPAPRFLLWIDGVGGYLVCQGDVVTLGQPVHGSYVDVPVLGDISRLHAIVRREAESYVIEPLRPTTVDGRPVERAALLNDSREIELGGGVRMRFRVPNPLSRTALLEFVSRHRTQPTTDGVLLMAESCVLGPRADAHVVCRNWEQQVVLYRQGEAMYCRAPGQFTVDGVEFTGQAPIHFASQIVGEDFSLSLEKL